MKGLGFKVQGWGWGFGDKGLGFRVQASIQNSVFGGSFV